MFPHFCSPPPQGILSFSVYTSGSIVSGQRNGSRCDPFLGRDPPTLIMSNILCMPLFIFAHTIKIMLRSMEGCPRKHGGFCKPLQLKSRIMHTSNLQFQVEPSLIQEWANLSFVILIANRQGHIFLFQDFGKQALQNRGVQSVKKICICIHMGFVFTVALEGMSSIQRYLNTKHYSMLSWNNWLILHRFSLLVLEWNS